MRLFWGLAILVSVTLLSCSKGEVKPSMVPDSRTLLFQHPEEIRHLLKGGEVYCKGECPEYVGAFYMFHNPRQANGYIYHDVKLCSATLIGKDKVLTNRHCIENIISEGESCNKTVQIQIKFPTKAPLTPEIYDCDKVLRTSPYYAKHLAPDWAVIKLRQAVNRKPVDFDGGNIKDGLDVRLFPTYFDTSPQFNSAVGVIQEVRCTRAINDNMNIFAFEEEAPLFKLTNCTHTLVNGNSGSGVFRVEQDSLIGVMASSETTEDGVEEANGTMAHCLPDFSGAEQSCFYSLDPQYITISKHISFLNHLSRNTRVANFNQELNRMAPQWYWEEESFEKHTDKDSNFKLTIKLKSPWSEHVSYLEARDQRLKNKYINSFKRLHFPKRAKCIKKESLGENLYFPVVKADWNSAGNLWQEVFVHRQVPSTVTAPDWNHAEPEVKMLPIKIIEKGKKDILLKIDSQDLPAPIEDFELRIAICR